MIKWLRCIFGGGHTWKLERGHVSNTQLSMYETAMGGKWSLSTYYESTDTGILIYGWVCTKCGKTKPATKEEAQV